MNKDVTASLVLYKSNPSQFFKTIDSYFSSPFAGELIIVDNSPDASLFEVIKDRYCNYLKRNVIKYANLVKNPGYGSAHNYAYNLRKTKSCYHIILNPDITFSGEIIESMIGYMDKDPHVGHLMPKVYNPDGTIQYLCKLLPTPADLFIRRFIPIPGIKEKLSKKFELKMFDYNNIANIPYLSGCFMFLRCSAFEKAGKFDERFFMYPEDMDLTRRIHKDYKTQYFPLVSIIHEHGKESYKSTKMLIVHIKNIIKYFNKWGWFFDDERKQFNIDTLKAIMDKK